MKDLHGLYVYHPARSAAIARLDRLVAATRHLSSPGASEIFCVPISTRIDPSGFLHKHLQPRSGHIAMSHIPQRARPFADRLTIGTIGARAANDDSKRVCVPVEWEIGKFERLSQEPSTHS
jgi:hypothetical protein